jgi:hypothetical protein
MLSAKAGLRTTTIVSVPGFDPPLVVIETLYELTFERALAELDRSPTLGSGAALGAALAAGTDGAADGWDAGPAEAGVPPPVAAAAGVVVADELPHAASKALTLRANNTERTRFGATGLPFLPSLKGPDRAILRTRTPAVNRYDWGVD